MAAFPLGKDNENTLVIAYKDHSTAPPSINVTANGFTGTVDLSPVVCPTSSTPGTFAVTVTRNSGSLTRTATARYRVNRLVKGGVNCDRKVNIVDLVTTGAALGSRLETRSGTLWPISTATG